MQLTSGGDGNGIVVKGLCHERWCSGYFHLTLMTDSPGMACRGFGRSYHGAA